ncbi:MAG TPA: hypothetical protein PK605_08680, partial [Ignavibacteria bacterium]|nr:hypothetical protein [Ignavibacteria bacterium]
ITILFNSLPSIYSQNKLIPDSIKGDTVYLHSIVINEDQIVIKRNSYEEALETAKSTIENLKWFLLIIIGFIGALFTWIKYRDDKKLNESIVSYENKLVESKNQLDEKVKEIVLLEIKVNDNYKKYEELIKNFIEIDTKFNNFKKELPTLEARLTGAIEKSEFETNISKAYRLIDQASLKIKDKDFNKTLELLNTAIQLLPKNDDIITYAYDLRGQCQFELDNFNLAIEDWEKAVEINKEPAYSLNNLGNIYVLLNNLPKAITFYESSLSMENSYITRINLILTKLELDKNVEVLAELQKVNEIIEESDKSFMEIIWAIYFAYKNNEEQALKHIDESKNFERTDMDNNYLARVYSQLYTINKNPDYKSKVLFYLLKAIENKTYSIKKYCISKRFEHFKEDIDFISSLAKCNGSR